MRRFLPLLACLLAALPATAQTDGLHQLGDDVERFLLRHEAAGRLPGIDLSNRPLSAYEAQAALDRLAADSTALSPTDARLLARFRGAAPGPGIGLVQRLVGPAYANGRDLAAFSGDGYAVQLNPLATLSLGQAAQRSGAGDPDAQTTYQNTRGARASGHIGDTDGLFVFFESRVEENQRQVPLAGVEPYGARIGVRYLLPREPRQGDLYDYWVVTGVLGVRSRHVEARFGRDRYAWGPTATGPLLSGYAPTYDHLQLRTTLGPFTYTNLFAAFNDLTLERDSLSNQIAAKYGSMHRLSVRLPGQVEIGVYEAAVLAPTPNDRDLGFYFAYFNPIIFYRALDFEKGSPANALLGLDAAWTLPERWLGRAGATLYGDFVLDEFRASEFFSGSGWKDNKWGLVIGARVAEVLPGLLVEAEYARLRPYLYSSKLASRSLTHHTATLGHPAGPNAQDASLRLDYRPMPRLTLGLAGAVTWRGRNVTAGGGIARDSEIGTIPVAGTDGGLPPGNYGADPFIGYDFRFPQEYGNTVGQGVGQTRALVEGRLGYELLPGLFAEAGLRYYDQQDEGTGATARPDLTRGFTDLFVSFRWGLAPPSYRY